MSWELVEIGSFLKERKGRFKPDDKEIKNLKRIDKINFSGEIFLSDKSSKTNMILIKKGDLVISGINVAKGAMAIYHGDENVKATIHYSSYIYDKDKIDIEFLSHFLKSQTFINAIKEQIPGGIKTEIKPKHILPLKVYIPTSIKEQREIVKILNNRNQSVNSISTELTHQLNLVKQLRQAFLREAMQGKLTADWREQNPDIEPASELLAKIKAEKERLIKEKKIKKQKPLSPITKDEIPFEIPENWVWCRLGEIITFGPTNGYSPRASKNGQGIKCLTLTATTSGLFNPLYYKYVDENISDDSYLWIQDKDILLQRGNSIDFVGIAALCENINDKYIYPDLMIKIRFGEFIHPNYIHKLLISPIWREYFQNNASGAQKSMPKINQKVVIKTLIPLPSLSEQKVIVEKLDKLMAYCDQLEKSIKNSQSQNEMLLQQVLREALEPKIENTKEEEVKL